MLDHTCGLKVSSPLPDLGRARDHSRGIKATSGLPEGGARCWRNIWNDPAVVKLSAVTSPPPANIRPLPDDNGASGDPEEDATPGTRLRRAAFQSRGAVVCGGGGSRWLSGRTLGTDPSKVEEVAL